MELTSFLEKNKIPFIFGLLGLILLGGGLLVVFKGQSEDKIEIISEEFQTTEGKIFVDIEGAVEKPGVYELPSGSRVNDLLIAAGGLSAEADREWVEKTLNRAQKLADGVKIYVPKTDESIKGITSTTSTTGSSGARSLMNINTASQSELEVLWGIGPVTAQKIIENRPYQSVDELLSKKILKSNVYERIVDSLSVY